MSVKECQAQPCYHIKLKKLDDLLLSWTRGDDGSVSRDMSFMQRWDKNIILAACIYRCREKRLNKGTKNLQNTKEGT